MTVGKIIWIIYVNDQNGAAKNKQNHLQLTRA
jgi:hypothetical protein